MNPDTVIQPKTWPRVGVVRWLRLALVIPALIAIGCHTNIARPEGRAAADPVKERQEKNLSIPDLDLDLVWIAPGSFLMGSPDNEIGHQPDEGPQTKVTLTQPYWLGRTPVTQRQYEKLMGTNPSGFKMIGPNAPVEQVSWEDAMSFCQKLTEMERVAGRLPTDYAYTLPTEAQWEFACRAGTTGPYAGDLDAMAWYVGNSGIRTHPVGLKAPNAWGLFDIYGNVLEWCQDWYGPYAGGEAINPVGPSSGSNHVNRGCCWDSAAPYCRSAWRGIFLTGLRSRDVGFRLALSSVLHDNGQPYVRLTKPDRKMSLTLD